MNTNQKIVRRDYNKVEVDIALRGKKIHIVFVADSGHSMYMYHLSGAGRLNNEQASQLANKVNRENETGTGTLYPEYAITIVPLSVFHPRDDLGDREVMRTHIKDVFKANEEHVKLPEIFFCIEPRPDFDYHLAQEIINELLTGTYQYTKIISSL